MKSLKITALSLVLVLLLAACGAKNDTPDEPAVDPTPEPPIEQPVEKTPDERINDIIADMSIEEKVGQGVVVLLIAPLHGGKIALLLRIRPATCKSVDRHWKPCLQRHDVGHPAGQPTVAFTERVHQQQLGVDLRHITCDPFEGPWAARRLGPERLALDERHVLFNAHGRRPREAPLGHIHGSIASRPTVKLS